jgi:hypothetical protein
MRKSVNQGRESHHALRLFGLLLGFSLYSYRVQELLVCWLFFSLLFVSLALVILGGMLACYAGKYVIRRVTTAARLRPVVAFGSDNLHLQNMVEQESSSDDLAR